MTDLDTTVPARARPNRRLRHMAVTASAALAMTLVPTIGTAGAITFTDPDDRCLPDAEAPPAPVTDRDQITPIQVPSVDCVFAQGIAVGMMDNTYGPFMMTTRGQMATFIVRALEAAGYTLPAASDQGFTDIAGNTHEENIQRLAAAGITSGKTATTYAPTELVQRDQMASFLVQAAEYAFAAALRHQRRRRRLHGRGGRPRLPRRHDVEPALRERQHRSTRARSGRRA